MPSVLPGYEYGIFISYRQKDNKHDGWVTEFVDQLKGELEATFKEEISVYFDINPHDGLLETPGGQGKFLRMQSAITNHSQQVPGHLSIILLRLISARAIIKRHLRTCPCTIPKFSSRSFTSGLNLYTMPLFTGI